MIDNVNEANEIAKEIFKEKKFRLSVCTIFSGKDTWLLQGLIDSVPEGSQLILMETVPTDCEEAEVKFLSKMDEDGITIYQYTWHYPRDEFSFAAAKNAALEQATGDWVLVMDADERLLPDPNLKEYLREDVQAYEVLIASPKISGPHEAGGLIRLFVNDRRFRFENRVHEQIGESILRTGGEIGRCPLIIGHLGYFREPDDMLTKYIRNCHLMIKDLAENFDNKYLFDALLREMKKVEYARDKR